MGGQCAGVRLCGWGRVGTNIIAVRAPGSGRGWGGHVGAAATETLREMLYKKTALLQRYRRLGLAVGEGTRERAPVLVRVCVGATEINLTRGLRMPSVPAVRRQHRGNGRGGAEHCWGGMDLVEAGQRTTLRLPCGAPRTDCGAAQGGRAWERGEGGSALRQRATRWGKGPSDRREGGESRKRLRPTAEQVGFIGGGFPLHRWFTVQPWLVFWETARVFEGGFWRKGRKGAVLG
jgi:hypothetical protein